MSLATSLGSERNLFEETPEHAHKLILDQPILLNRALETLRHVSHEVFAAETIDITWPVSEGAAGMAKAIERICRQADEAIPRYGRRGRHAERRQDAWVSLQIRGGQVEKVRGTQQRLLDVLRCADPCAPIGFRGKL